MKKTILVLLLLVIISNSVACDKTVPDENTSDIVIETVPETPEEPVGTGLEAIDYGGAEIRFLIRDHEVGDPRWGSRELISEGITGDVLNDAVVERNDTIEEKYNIKITAEKMTYNQLSTQLTNIVATADDVYDCVMTSVENSAKASARGELQDLLTMDHLDFSADWWDQSCNDSLTIMNRLYFAVGDMNIMTHDGTAAMFFNKSLLDDYQLENPYDLVESGKWTIDKYIEMTVESSRDLDSNGVMDKNDFWGSVCTTDKIFALIVGCGEHLAGKNEFDEPYFHELDENYLNVLSKVAACTGVGKTYNSQSPAYNAGQPTDFSIQYEIFCSNRALFITEVIESANQLRSTDYDFGIVPYPKYNEAQDHYISAINSWASTANAIPITTADTDRITRIMEDMAYYSHQLLQPAYYDITLQVKLTRDEKSTEMLDILFGHRVLDIGWAYNFGNVKYDVLLKQISSGNNDFASAFAAIQKPATAQVEALVDQYRSVTDN